MGFVRILVLAFLGFLAYSLFRRFLEGSRKGGNPNAGDERLGRLVQDPHCGVWVDSKEAEKREVSDGALFFCSKKCAKAYLEEKSAEKDQDKDV